MIKSESLGPGRFGDGYPDIQKLLIAAPIHSSKKYIAKQYFDNVKELDCQNNFKVDYLFVDNSKTEYFMVDLAIAYDLKIVRGRVTSGNSRIRQTASLNMIREYFLGGDYDILFLLESDLIPNHDIVEHLVDHDKDACSAVYKLSKGIPCITQNNYIANKGGFSNVFVNRKFIDGELREVPNGCGLGCVAIKRKVLEKIKFRSGVRHADTYFWEDFRAYGFKAYVDTSQVVRHYPSEYKDY
jgi:hypothetical protein